MAHNIASLIDLSVAHVVSSEDARMAAYSGFTLIALNSSQWAKPGEGIDEKTTRANLAVLIDNVRDASGKALIPKTTWEAYAAGVFRCAAKFADNLANDPAFIDIRDLPEVEAIEAMQNLYAAHGVYSGADIRAWGAAPGFELYDKEAAAKARKEAAAAKAKEKQQGAALAWAARSGTDSATVAKSDLATVTPADPVAAVTALLGGMTEAQLLLAMTAINERISTLDALKAIPATVAPVVADDATVDPKSAQAAITARVAAAA